MIQSRFQKNKLYKLKLYELNQKTAVMVGRFKEYFPEADLYKFCIEESTGPDVYYTVKGEDILESREWLSAKPPSNFAPPPPLPPVADQDMANAVKFFDAVGQLCPECGAGEGSKHEPYCSKVGPADPGGIDQHTPGAKLDAGKIYADSILAGFPRALTAVAEVGTFGANKYSLNGWKEVPDGIRRYKDAAMRHKLKMDSGEAIDPESGLPHAYHYAWNVLAVLELELK